MCRVIVVGDDPGIPGETPRVNILNLNLISILHYINIRKIDWKNLSLQFNGYHQFVLIQTIPPS